MQGWRELCVGCSLSVGIGRTVSVQVLVAKTDIGDTVVLTVRSALVSCMKEGLVMLGKNGIETPAQIRFGVVHGGRFDYELLGKNGIETPAQIRFGVVNEGRFGYVRKEWNRNPRYTGPDLLWYRA